MTERIGCVVSDELKEEIEAEAEQRRRETGEPVSQSDIIREALRNHLDVEDAES